MERNDCMRCYYGLCLQPERGRAMLSTCWSNVFRRENVLFCSSGLKEAWNCGSFQAQRKRVLNSDRRHCLGANCCFPPYSSEAGLFLREEVKSAVLRRKTALEYLPKMLSIIVSFACNNACGFCYQSLRRREKSQALPPGIIEELKHGLLPSAERVNISGGEPFFCRQTRDLIEWMMEQGMGRKLWVNTNAVLLHETGIEKLISRGVFLSVSFYGMTAKTYKKATGRENFEKMSANVRDIIAGGHERLVLKYLVSRDTHAEARGFCRFIEENPGVKAIVYNDCYSGRRYWGLMKELEKEFSGLSPNLRFQYQSETPLQVFLRRTPLFVPGFTQR